MGQSDYYLEGAWNARCMECWKKIKSDDALRRWDGCWVCSLCFEIRNPQDFARGIPDRQNTPWTAPNPPNNYINDTGTPTPTEDYSMVLNSYYLGSKPLG